ncbi:MAG: Stp1/IreP family PP2C-type Ser/Thr phosphatase [Deltaproteobacteria bacterium]|nr:Stp1/IreP family PP2C-type Ser/Thr phosphatase [Deltaproteobacteria bacterium]
MRIDSVGRTHVGMKRDHNEDNFQLVPEVNLFIVADGMGGHAAGEVASGIAVEEVAEFFRMTERDEEATWPNKMDRARNYDENRLATAIMLSNTRIREAASADARQKDMGTTIVTTFFKPEATYVGHVGDSRVYRFRAGELTQITEDHSLLNQYIKAKKLTPEEIENFPHKNVISRALGMKDQVEVDVVADPSREGDVYVLCSDGLSGMIKDEEMARILAANLDDLDTCADRLIEAANANGGHDNVTVVLARYHA